MREPAPYQPSPRDPDDPHATRLAQQWPTSAPAQPPAPVTPAMPATPGAAVATTTIDSPTVIRRRTRRRSVLGDVTAGIFLGDFATDLGLPGAITQIAISFVPLIGSTCAMRDLVADLRHHDHTGALLNALALTPILGGFSKTFEVIRSTAHIGHAMHISHEQAQRHRETSDVSQPTARRSRQ